MKIVISHIYNEEFLLPYWLKHTKLFFDHGIIIDYQSTDKSLEIIKKICPTWEIRPSKLEFFAAKENDDQVMEIERETRTKHLDAWFMALNTTEFLVSPNLDENLKHPTLGCVQIYLMVEHPCFINSPLLSNSLLETKWFGYPQPIQFGRKLIHKKECGEYHIGRHIWKDFDQTPLLENTIIAKFVWSPMEQGLPRKMQIQNKIPESDKQRGFGGHHLINEHNIHALYQHELNQSYWLYNDTKYFNAVSQFLLRCRTSL